MNHSKTKKVEGYPLLGITPGVCNGNVVILGTRIEPRHIVGYGTMEEISEDFNLTKEQVRQALDYYEQTSKSK